MLDTKTGEVTEHRLEHENGEARTFYAALAGPTRIGQVDFSGSTFSRAVFFLCKASPRSGDHSTDCHSIVSGGMEGSRQVGRPIRYRLALKSMAIAQNSQFSKGKGSIAFSGLLYSMGKTLGGRNAESRVAARLRSRLCEAEYKGITATVSLEGVGLRIEKIALLKYLDGRWYFNEL